RRTAGDRDAEATAAAADTTRAGRARRLAAVLTARLRARAEALRVRRTVGAAVLLERTDARRAGRVDHRHVGRAEHARQHRAHQHARGDAVERRVVAGV